MLKAILNLKKLKLRLKEGLLSFTIKKDHQEIKETPPIQLINTLCNIDQILQFYISKETPSFDIIITFSSGKTTKMAGLCHIDLRLLEENVYHDNECVLEKCPDSKASLAYTIIYYTSSQVHTSSKSLLSWCNLQKLKRKNIQKANNLLAEENHQLLKHILDLQERNEELEQENNSIKVKYDSIIGDKETKLRLYQAKIRGNAVELKEQRKENIKIMRQIEVEDQEIENRMRKQWA